MPTHTPDQIIAQGSVYPYELTHPHRTKPNAQMNFTPRQPYSRPWYIPLWLFSDAVCHVLRELRGNVQISLEKLYL